MVELDDKEYRDAYSEGRVENSIAHQIAVLRQQRGWTQQELAQKMGTAQNVISRLEDPTYGKMSIGTLHKLASAFDVALRIQFTAFSNLLFDAENQGTDTLRVSPFSEDRKYIAIIADASPVPKLAFAGKSAATAWRITGNSVEHSIED